MSGCRLSHATEKAFFFEKKKQKTFSLRFTPAKPRASSCQSFLFLFFKKGLLAFRSPSEMDGDGRYDRNRSCTDAEVAGSSRIDVEWIPLFGDVVGPEGQPAAALIIYMIILDVVNIGSVIFSSDDHTEAEDHHRSRSASARDLGSGRRQRRVTAGTRMAAAALAAGPADVMQTGEAGCWSVRVVRHHCVGPIGELFMFGGMGLGFAVRIFETQCKLPLRWVTMQYLAPSPLGSSLTFEVDRMRGSRTIQATLRGTIDGAEVVTAAAALGGRAEGAYGQWQRAPDVRPPEECSVVHAHAHADSDVHALLDIRLAQGRFGMFSKAPVSNDGHVVVWMRPRAGSVDAAMLAVMSDFVPSTSSNALATRAGGSSLDNTIRIVRLAPTEWVLCDIVVEAMQDGVGHGRMHLFTQDGILLAIASQSYLVRVLPPRRASPET